MKQKGFACPMILAGIILIIAIVGISWYLSNIQNSKTQPNIPVVQRADNIEGKFCGGIAANLPENQCPAGYKCQMGGNYPDAGGQCVKE